MLPHEKYVKRSLIIGAITLTATVAAVGIDTRSCDRDKNCDRSGSYAGGGGHGYASGSWGSEKSTPRGGFGATGEAMVGGGVGE